MKKNILLIAAMALSAPAFALDGITLGGTSGKRFDRQSCNIAIPVRVPQGFSVSVLKID